MPSIGPRPDFDPATAADQLDDASAILEPAGADGRVTKTELKTAEKKLARRFGPERAAELLVRILGQDPAKVDFKAVDFLQGKIGSMDNHIERYQEVLVGHLVSSEVIEAKILDVNMDGKLDPEDVIFTKDAAGEVDVARIGKALCDGVRISAAMVDGAHAMHEAEHEFGDIAANPDFWRVEPGALGTMFLKPGVKASDAIDDIFENPDQYSFECATALVILRYHAIKELIGPKDFNRICRDLKCGAWVQENQAAEAWAIRGQGGDGKVHAADDIEQTDMKPGDYTYFKNWSVSLSGWQGGWQGENVISLGDGMYYGHPFGITSGEDIVAHLNEYRQERGNVKTASLLDLRASLDPTILKHDKIEGD